MAERDLVGRTLGGFVLRERIDSGGYGDVYRAEHEQLGRKLVVKVLNERRCQDQTAKARFIREARIASLLDHDYAAHVYGFGVEPAISEDDGPWWWLAMEFVEGSTLRAWMNTHGLMQPDVFMQYFGAVAEVVHAAHQRGIVHRDLKPENLMVVVRGGRLIPKLIDFGTAKIDSDVEFRIPDARAASLHVKLDATDATDAVDTTRIRLAPRRAQRTPTPLDRNPAPVATAINVTQDGAGLGSTLYMAPEQWNHAQTATPASDIYALGVIAYEAMTGHVPFSASSTDDRHPRYSSDEAPPLGAGRSSDADRVIRRALMESPFDRHRSALDLAAELRAALQIGDRAQLLSAARHWQSRERAPGLLWGGDVLAEIEPLAKQDAGVLSELECSFIVESQQRARRFRWLKRTLISVLAVGVVGFFQYRASDRAQLAEERASAAQQLVAQQARAAQELAKATRTREELEKGRSALLHGEPDAKTHLVEAYRSDPTPGTAFMLARALQSTLAEQARFPATKGRMRSATFSPDGRQVVTTDDTSAQVWDASTHQRLFTLVHQDVVYQAIYNADGTQIVTACGDGAIRIWRAASGALLRELRRDNTTRYYAVAMAPDGRFVVAIDFEGRVANAWEVRSGALLATLPNDASELPSLALSPDGRWLATSGGNDARIFDTRTWSLDLTIRGPQIYGFSWDPSGPRLFTGSGQGEASIWDVPSGRLVRRLRPNGQAIDAVAFSPDGRSVVAASRDGTEQVWDATSGRLRGEGNYLHNKILSVEFDRTASQVVAAGVNGTIAIAEPTLRLPLAVLDRAANADSPAPPDTIDATGGFSNPVVSVHFDPSSKRVVDASFDGTARIWDATSPYRRWEAPPVEDDCGLIPTLEPNQRFLAIGCKSHLTRIWDTKEGRLLAELPSVTPINGDSSSAYPAISGLGDRAAIARGNVVEIYAIPDGHLVRKVVHHAAISAIAFSPSGEIASGAVDGSVLVTRSNESQLALPSSSSGIDAVGFLTGGRVVTTDARRRMRVFDEMGTRAADLEIEARAQTLRMSGDGRRLITVPNIMGQSASAELWDVERYRRVAELGSSDRRWKTYSARFAERAQIVVACSDGAVRIWDDELGELRRTFRSGARFFADATIASSMIIAGGGDGLIRFWDLSSGNPLWVMPALRSHVIGLWLDGNDIVTQGSDGGVSRWTLPKPESVIQTWRERDRAIVPR